MSKEYECLRCGYKWTSRKDDGDSPAQCPKCKNYNYDTPAKKKVKK